MIREFRSHMPHVAENAYVADSAEVIGDVRIGEGASIWPGAVLRGDVERIEIGCGSNIQDCAVVHTNHGAPTIVGSDVTVGHAAILHGCTVGDLTLVGMGAIVLDGVCIGRECLIGAGALVTQGVRIPDGSLVLGSPGKVVRQLTPEERAKLAASAREYRELAAAHRAAVSAGSR
jgi:carbonic anhydrase/acetyltransferase-like protein (isoleucine patch superfamily)